MTNNINKPIIPQIPFYFIRHGQTDWNLKHMIQGHTDIPLNETGIDQAKAAIAFLTNQGITQIISSPLLRAHKTAEIINEILQVSLHTHAGLRERYGGKLEGIVKTTSALTNIAHNYTQMTEDSETIDAFKKRVADALHEILHSDHVTLIVAHGGVY
jgi:probable phosphoglycerate mutase